jgi:hypothetical protein
VLILYNIFSLERRLRTMEGGGGNGVLSGIRLTYHTKSYLELYLNLINIPIKEQYYILILVK